MSKWEDYLVILAENQIILEAIFSKLATTLEGAYIHRDAVIPYMIIKSSKLKLGRIKDWLIILGTTDKKYIGKVNWIDRKDLE